MVRLRTLPCPYLCNRASDQYKTAGIRGKGMSKAVNSNILSWSLDLVNVLQMRRVLPSSLESEM